MTSLQSLSLWWDLVEIEASPYKVEILIPCPYLLNVLANDSRCSFKTGPLDLSFWSFLTFFHRGIIKRHLLWKFHKKIQRKSWSKALPKLLACIGFLYKVVHKIGHLRKFNFTREIEFNILPLGLSLWNLAHLFIMFMATKVASDF